LQRSPDSLPQPMSPAARVGHPAVPASSFAELFAQPRLFWLTVIIWFGASTANYGVFLWGPTIVALLMGVSPAEAAHLFVFISLTGMLGRIAFSFAAQSLGRRRCGEIMGYGIALFLGAAGLFFDHTIFGYPAFVVLLIPAAVFFDGGFSNIAPYSAEIFPVRMSARGVGLAQAANGLGKIAGPLCLALIAGTSNLITPKATVDAVTPAFLFLACCGLAIGVSFSLLGVETHGRKLALDGDLPPVSPPGTVASMTWRFMPNTIRGLRPNSFCPMFAGLKRCGAPVSKWNGTPTEAGRSLPIICSRPNDTSRRRRAFVRCRSKCFPQCRWTDRSRSRVQHGLTAN